MIRTYILPILALLGIVLGIRTVVTGNKPPPVAEPVVSPPAAPYRSFVAGSGIVESSSENIAISTQIPGVVKAIFVTVGQKVKSGDVLFTIDGREAASRVELKKAALEVAHTQLRDFEAQFAMWQKIPDRRAVSQEDFIKRKYSVATAQSQVVFAERDLQAAETELDRLTVRAPIDGEVLQVKVRVGEYAPAQVLQTPLMLLGNTETLHVRVDVDENDAWRVRENKPATAYLRGNSDIGTVLHFVRFEPYVVPKRSLTGDSAERVDTRVLQVLYRFKKSEFPVFVGQLMDVYIEAE